MTKIVVSIPFYLGRSAGKPAFYPVGRGDAPEADLESPFGRALEKGGYLTRVKEVATTPADDAGQNEAAGAAEKSGETVAVTVAPEATATPADTPTQDEAAGAAEKSEEPVAVTVAPEATATLADTPTQDEAAVVANKKKKSTAKGRGSE